MSTFKAPFIEDAAVREAFAQLERALNEAQPSHRLQVLTAEPARIRPGDLVFADGTVWNPGSGEGVYRRDAANAAWVFLG